MTPAKKTPSQEENPSAKSNHALAEVVCARKVKTVWHVVRGDAVLKPGTRSTYILENEERLASASSQVQAIAKTKELAEELGLMAAAPGVSGYHIEVICPECGMIGRNTNESYVLERCYDHWRKEHRAA